MSQSSIAMLKEKQIVRSGWQSLYTTGGIAALVMVLLIPIGAIPFVISQRPDTVTGWFALLQDNRLLGLALLDLPNLAVNLLGILLYLALYAALKEAHKSLISIAATLGIVAAGLYVTTNAAFGMLSLSSQYAAAATDLQKAGFLAAGQALLTIYQNSTAFNVSYVMGAIATLIISMVQFRSGIFSRLTGIAGILASVITLGLFVPEIGLYISVFSLVPYAVWLFLSAKTLFKMERGK